ncbi:MAG TPA: hypothetical protein VM261_07210 [Kofleriaceae bacterium]|nr:hypothetical protein [Kofleriaceae bacterium]
MRAIARRSNVGSIGAYGRSRRTGGGISTTMGAGGGTGGGASATGTGTGASTGTGAGNGTGTGTGTTAGSAICFATYGAALERSCLRDLEGVFPILNGVPEFDDVGQFNAGAEVWTAVQICAFGQPSW